MGSWNPSHSGIGELLCSDMVRRELRRRADRVKEVAEATSPEGPPRSPEDGPHYRDMWEVEDGVREEPSRRAYARVRNSSDHAAAVEFGNGRGDSPQTIQAHYVLTRAVDAARE
ncbi:MAG TPA: hypothetical protein VFV01_16860 [Spirillospora sp.]|nr:hypothetical protein [Spirillospora sp.]